MTKKVYSIDFLHLLKKRLVMFIGRMMVQRCKIRAVKWIHFESRRQLWKWVERRD